MWQLLLAAAAAAGSGILANKLINPNKAIPHQEGRHENQFLKEEEEKNGKIFRFCSPQTGPKKIGANRGKKLGSGYGQKRERKVTVCLKKRKTGKSVSGKCDSCASKDNSFGWGVSLGIMYMASAGKAEIDRLNSAMEDTGKIVQELKAEISIRKNLCNVHAAKGVSIAANETDIHGGELFAEPGNQSMYKMTPFGSSLTGGECGSSAVMEYQQHDILEMDLLEAELQTELQKLPWCTAEGLDGYIPQNNVVSAAELDKKLCEVVIERQGGQIAELEAELRCANYKLHEKEAELEMLKNCVKRIGEFSLDEECVHEGEDGETRVGIEGKPVESMVGMKRPMGSDAPDCYSE